MRPLRFLVTLVLVGVAACSGTPAPEASNAPAATSTSSAPSATTRPQSRIRVTTSTSSSADLICAEIQDPAFDLRPLAERRFIRMACAERESEAREELLRQSGALHPPEPPDDADAYEPEYPEPDSEPYEPVYP
jgi:hypothetical protein